MLTPKGIKVLPPAKVNAQRVGWKAFGLVSLPEAWCCPLVVIDAEVVPTSSTDNRKVQQLLQSIGIDADDEVIVRSSGSHETLPQAGRQHSEVCSGSRVADTIAKLAKRTSSGGRMHWVVQEHQVPQALGHFSNERRVSREKRDWLAEVEPRSGRPGFPIRVAVRAWRDGTNYTKGSLNCASEAAISLSLKQVAMWANQFDQRIHFEWLWDGTRLLLVQAVPEETVGVSIPSLPPKIPNAHIGDLKAFRQALPTDFDSLIKLKNAQLYQRIGYQMPPFYLLDDQQTLRAILDGKIKQDLRHDLQSLTNRPLIIRTDGHSIPKEKREMLPRSDELRTASDAERWLKNSFRRAVEKSELTEGELVLIAHHFIPSVSSAWARAEPRRALVRIEALWGIPEGLYWFSHDTIEVDTQVVDIPYGDKTPTVKVGVREKIRYKGTYWGADESGKWDSRRTAPPYDWRSTISPRRWLSEIAWTTRKIADRENEAVSVMWFVDNHPKATKHRLLPWYHQPSDIGRPKQAPPRKFGRSSDYRVESTDDWVALRSDLAGGKTVDRVVVEPTDPTLIRDREFTTELAQLSRDKGFVIELSGGILSHAYYMLQGLGAKVECVDLFGSDEDVAEFNKVVRDRIPEEIERRGEKAQRVRLTGDALIVALKQKLVEEALETLDAHPGEEILGELADVSEVVAAICAALGLTLGDVERERILKKRRRGGFDRGFMLTRTTSPRSIPASTKGGGQAPEIPDLDTAATSISDPQRIPSKAVYRKPDLRQSEPAQLEKLLTIEIDINQLGDLKEALEFSFPEALGGSQRFSMALELKRLRGVMRAVARVRRVDEQLPLALVQRDQVGLSPDGAGPMTQRAKPNRKRGSET